MKNPGVLVSSRDCACHCDILGNVSALWIGWGEPLAVGVPGNGLHSPALFTEICRVGSNVLLPVISIGAGLCLRRRHTQGKAGTSL